MSTTEYFGGLSQNFGDVAPAGLPNPAVHGLDLAIQAEQIPNIWDRPYLVTNEEGVDNKANFEYNNDVKRTDVLRNGHT
jgi:hypothetical protein